MPVRVIDQRAFVPASSPLAGVRLARLEFGKLCVSPDGPIVSRTMEHRQLGWSPEFPRELIPFCEPSGIGVSTQEMESLPRECAHGTVLRPVLLSQNGNTQWIPERHALPVLCRLRKRPEDGEIGRGRLYTLARYLVARQVIDPMVMLSAMDFLPLVGTTEEAAATLQDLLVTQPALSDFQAANPATKDFLPQALKFVMSGIPIGIAEQIEETKFFELVTSLWRLLPGMLRPFLSAGWGIGGSLSGRLTISYAEQIAVSCAAFFPSSGKWEKPSEVLFLDKKGNDIFSPFNLTALKPGENYSNYLFSNNAQTGSSEISPEVIEKIEKILDPPPRDTFEHEARPVDFRDSATIGIFRYPGRNIHDVYLLENLQTYLNTGDETFPGGVESLLKALSVPVNKLEAFSMAKEAHSIPATCERAEHIIWNLLKLNDPNVFSDLLDGPQSARLRFLAALQTNNADGNVVLKALCDFMHHGQPYPLPAEASQKVKDLLSAGLPTLDQTGREYHRTLLLADEPPPNYRDWLRIQGFDLALASFDWPYNHPLAETIYRLTNSDSVDSLLRCASGKAPSPVDEQIISGLADQSRIRFCNWLGERWRKFEKDTADYRRILFQWIQLGGKPEQINDPLLALALDFNILPKQFTEIAFDVESRKVPLDLIPKVATFTLQVCVNETPCLNRIRDNLPRWVEVLKYWPRALLLALYPINKPREIEEALKTKAGSEADRLRERGVELLSRFALPDYEIEQLIEAWRKAPNSNSRQQSAQLYWKWIQRAQDTQYEAPIVHICRYVCQRIRQIPERENTVWDNVDKAVSLAVEVETLPELKVSAKTIWNLATDAKHLFTLLKFFHDMDFVATVPQEEALASHQEQAKQMARTYDFGIVAIEPMSIKYPQYANIQWSDEYTKSAFWLAFHSVPSKKQGCLKHALRVYYGENFYHHAPEKCAETCRTYLQFTDERDMPQAVEKVLRDFVIPYLRHGLGHSSRDENWRDLKHNVASQGKLAELIDVIRDNTKEKDIEKVLDTYYKLGGREAQCYNNCPPSPLPIVSLITK